MIFFFYLSNFLKFLYFSLSFADKFLLIILKEREREKRRRGKSESTMSGCKQMSILSCITELDESSPRKCADQAATILVSPISGIVHELMNTTLSQHNCSKRKNNITNENLGK